jgi:hypothetical protein
VVFLAGNNPNFVIDLNAQRWIIPLCTQMFSVQPLSRSLISMQPPETCVHDNVQCTQFFGRLYKTQVTEVVRGPKKKALLICYGET